MATREPIHLGSGEPVLLLHAGGLSQTAWRIVAQQLADTGQWEVFAPTLAGHNGGPSLGTWFARPATLADHIERQLDELGWSTAHIVGNSLGGWLAFELERRGRARTVTGIAPAGGWSRWSLAKFGLTGKFMMGIPVLVLLRRLMPRTLALLVRRWYFSTQVGESELRGTIDDVTHCPGLYQMQLSSLLAPGLMELDQTAVPVHVVFCEKDRFLPASRFGRHFMAYLPTGAKVTRLDGLGHVPMLDAPDRVTQVIIDFLDHHRTGGR